MGIVHFDLKPENVVSFISGSGGPSQRMRWKLIDLDSSHDIKSKPSSTAFSSVSPRVVLSCESLRSSESALTVWLTQEYAAPEVVRVIDQLLSLPTPSAAASHLAPLPIDASMDIWSVGMIGYFLLTNRSFWGTYSPATFKSSLVTGVRQADVSSVLSGLTLIEHKERSFLESCLQVDADKRWSASELLKKSLFSTSSSTVAAKDLRASKEELQRVVGELYAARTQAFSSSSSSSSSSLSSEEVTIRQLEEFGQWLAHLLSLNFAEMADLLKSQPHLQALTSAGK
jgi:serine/threonine protein kinase